MLRDLFLVILVYAFFLNIEATMSAYGVLPNTRVPLNRSSLFTNIDPMINEASRDDGKHVYVSNVTLHFFYFCTIGHFVLSSNMPPVQISWELFKENCGSYNYKQATIIIYRCNQVTMLIYIFLQQTRIKGNYSIYIILNSLNL